MVNVGKPDNKLQAVLWTATSTPSFVVSLYEVQCGTLSSAERSVWTLIFKEALLLLMLAYDGCWKTNSRRPFLQTICVAYRDFVHNVKQIWELNGHERDLLVHYCMSYDAPQQFKWLYRSVLLTKQRRYDVMKEKKLYLFFVMLPRESFVAWNTSLISKHFQTHSSFSVLC